MRGKLVSWKITVKFVNTTNYISVCILYANILPKGVCCFSTVIYISNQLSRRACGVGAGAPMMRAVD